MSVRDQFVELGLELAARLSSQQRAVANARTATTDLSRARVERDAVDLFLAERLDDEPEETAAQRESRASGT